MKLYRKIAIILVAVVAGIATSSAEMRTSYFMEGSYFRTDMNAALAPTRGYIKLPVAGAVGLDFGNNYFSVSNLFYKKDGGIYTFMHNSVSADEFLGKLGNKGKMSVNLNTSILGFGAHTKKLFWSFGLNLRSNTEVTLSKEMFAAIKNLSNGYYNLGDTHISNREYMEAAIGFAIPVKKWMTFGFRAKGLLGLADLSMQMDKMYLDINENQVKAELMGGIRGNCPAFRSNYPIGVLEDFDMEQLIHQNPMDMLKGIKSWGLGLDVGFEFRLLDDHLKLSIGANDIGFIRWYQGSTVNANGSANFTYDGFNLTTSEAKMDGGFEAELIPSTGSYTTRLSASLNAGVEYNILSNYIAFGVLSHTEFCQNFTRTELTASVNFRIGRWLTTSFSHTFLNGNQPGVLGWALNIHPPGFNLFIGADYIDTRFAVMTTEKAVIPIPKMMTSANVYLGVGFNLGKAKYMPSMQERSRKANTLKRKAMQQ
ncbi:MAG: hypothetical protein IKA07_02820 [Alistipes sp.]|nr:hypothetical protein [Alistipes sp.]